MTKKLNTLQQAFQHLNTRRGFLEKAGTGFGSLALGAMMASENQLSASNKNPLSAKPPHHPARAKRVVHLFMNGAPSHVDTFDRKVSLEKYDGKKLPVHYETERKTGMAYKSPFKFQQYGQSGIEVSELFSKTAKEHIDDMCIIRSMHCTVPNHPPALMEMNCGDFALSRPSMGSWINYGLGTENKNLPGFVSLCPGGHPAEGPRNWQSSFLPAAYQGTYINTEHTKLDKLIDNIRNSNISSIQQKQQIALMQQLNELQTEASGDDGMLESRLQSFDLAYRMQMEAADVFDLSNEPKHVHERYGKSVHARQLITTRRLLEKGVRFVQVWTDKNQPWDHHDNIMDHKKLASAWDQPIAAFLGELKERGLLEDTLVLWGGEFGRTPTVELPTPGINRGLGKGRDHNSYGFSVWMAGGGVKGGHVHGATDEFGFKAVQDRLHVHDLHATILHLLGLDHERLTYRYAGRDFRLTDVHGHVAHSIIA